MPSSKVLDPSIWEKQTSSREPLGPIEVDLSGDAPSPFSRNDEGFVKVENQDGSVTVSFGGWPEEDDDKPNKFGDNLAKHMDDFELAGIASEILEGIQADELSRQDWLDARAKAISLLGLKVEEPRGDTGTSSAPLEGQSTVRHPLLLEATVAFQAGARSELLPSKGPVKVRSDTPPGAPATPPGMPPTGQGDGPADELAQALETDLNHYLTSTAKEYVPDTDRMLFTVAYSGDSFKKGYHCPLRRRPVLESIDPEDFIVSNAATDLANCGRITHRIRMRRATMRRMQLIGAYRDVLLVEPQPEMPDVVKEKKADVGGHRAEPMRPKDSEYTLYESYVELDLPKFAPRHLKDKGLPIPYKITIEKHSRKILEIRRNWREGDPLCLAKQVFVQFPFIRGLGFYGLGFIHLLGNTTLALTAAWREQLDAGMFANFPAFIYAKQLGRQLTNQFRAPPGGGIPVDLPPNARLQDSIMPFPYKEVGPAFPAFIQRVEDGAKQLAMIANAPVGEGKQDAPVGTTLALIEQATKVVASAFKRLHNAQAEEFALLKELFREDPEAMWRFNAKPAMPWVKSQFLAALDRYELVPVADPNNPTSLHRAMKSALLKTLQAASPMIYDPIAVDRRIMSIAGIDPEGLFKPPSPQADPVQMALQARQMQTQMMAQIRQQELQIKAATSAMNEQGKAADRASRERIAKMQAQVDGQRAQMDYEIERLKLVGESVMNVQNLMRADRDHAHQAKESDRQFGAQQHQAHQDHVLRTFEALKPEEKSEKPKKKEGKS